MKRKLITSMLMTMLLTAAIGHQVFAQKKDGKSRKVANLPPPPPPPPPAKAGETPPPPRVPKGNTVVVQQKDEKKALAADPAQAPLANK
jgi:hypothetical protein